MSKFKFFTSLGQELNEGLCQIIDGVHALIHGSSESNDSCGSMQTTSLHIINYFTSKIGSEVEVEPASPSTSYNDILKWAGQNLIGNKIYLVKYTEKKTNTTLLCVFFAQDDTLLLNPQNPKKCYVFRPLPTSIEDLFNNNDIFVQPIK